MLWSRGWLSRAIGGRRAFTLEPSSWKNCGISSSRAGIDLLAGTQQFGLEGTSFWIRDPYNGCWLAINLSRTYAYKCGNRSKGPCKEFQLRKPCVLCWKPSRKFFFSSSRKYFFRESFAKVGYYNHYLKGCHPLPPGSGRRRALENSFWFWFSSLCGGACGQSHPS